MSNSSLSSLTNSKRNHVIYLRRRQWETIQSSIWRNWGTNLSKKFKTWNIKMRYNLKMCSRAILRKVYLELRTNLGLESMRSLKNLWNSSMNFIQGLLRMGHAFQDGIWFICICWGKLFPQLQRYFWKEKRIPSRRYRHVHKKKRRLIRNVFRSWRKIIKI